MAALDAIDHTFNTTSIPSSGRFNATAGQYFCQMTKADVRCINSAQFAAQPFDELCPSGDCWTDCQDLSRLYSPLPSGITFADQNTYGGNASQVMLWPLCASLGNISLAIASEVAPPEDTKHFELYFKNNTKGNLRAVADATTHCWTDTCAAARYPDNCAAPCAAVNVLESRIFTQLAGTRECIRQLCLNIDGLPFGNQDVVGIGVTISYVIQALLVIVCWVALAVSGYVSRRHRRQSTQDYAPSEHFQHLLQGISGFHNAQCYFSIPLAIAALFTNPFEMDPLNAFGLLPMSINGFLPQIFTIMILRHFGVQPWYPLLLTVISYLLNSIIFFAVIIYLNSIQDQGTALDDSAYESLGDINSCGGLTGLGICLHFQADSPPAFLIQKFGKSAWVGIQLSPFIWTLCTLLLTFLVVSKLRSSQIWSGFRSSRSSLSSLSHRILYHHRIAILAEITHHRFAGTIAYGATSALFLAALIFQAVMFYSYVSLGLVDLQTWSFGQIVAIAVWMPPLIDYVHQEFDTIIKKIYPQRLSGYATPDAREPLAAINTSYSSAKDQAYMKADDHDREDWRSTVTADTHSGDIGAFPSAAHPNEFPLQPIGARSP